MDMPMKMRLMLCVCFLGLLTGCDQTTLVEDRVAEPTSVPPQLRMIAPEELQANVTIDGVTTEYYGSNYPAGNWTIELTLVVGQEYDILIEWLASGVLLLEQSTKIVAEVTGSPVLPEYTSISYGAARFDSDCDGETNLEESIANTNPLIAEDPLQDGCNTVPDPVVDPDELLAAFVAQDLPRFDSRGITTRVKRFVIPMRVQTLDWKEQHWYNLVLEEDANTSTIWRGYIVDVETGVEPLVATSQTAPDVIWIEPDIGQAFKRSFTASQCAGGLPALTTQFQDALVNDTVVLGAPRGTNLMSGCVRVGAGASTDITYEDGKPIYSLVLGQ